MKNFIKMLSLAVLVFSLATVSHKAFAYGGGGVIWTGGNYSYSTNTTATPVPGKVLGATAFSFTKNLKLGSNNSEVLALQKFLNLKGYTVATAGAGSSGNETSYFGAKTKAALIKYQDAQKDLLNQAGISKGTGNFFSSSINFVNNLLLDDANTSRILAGE